MELFLNSNPWASGAALCIKIDGQLLQIGGLKPWATKRVVKARSALGVRRFSAAFVR
jgi:hypothetical protein